MVSIGDESFHSLEHAVLEGLTVLGVSVHLR